MLSRAQRISRNLALLTVAQFFSRGFAFIVTIHLARTLLADNFGIIVLGTTILTYAELVVNAGINTLGPREVARDANSVPRLTQTVVTLRILLALVSFFILATLLVFSPGLSTTKFAILIYGVSLFTTALDLSWIFLGLEMMRYTALAEIAGQALTALAVLIFVQSPADTLRVPIIYLAAELTSALLLIYYYRRHFGNLRLGIDRVLWRPLAWAALPLAASSAMGMITFNFDTLAVGLSLGTHFAGIYGAAYRVIWVPSLVAAAYFTALNPSLFRAYKEGLDSVASLLDKSVRLTTAIAFGLGVGGVALATAGFDLLYGPGFQDSILPFQILVWSIALLFVNRNYRYILIAFNRQQIELRVITVAAVTNVALNLVLIPRFHLAGAAVATVASETVILIFGYLYTRTIVGHVPFGRHVPRIALAATAMAVVLYLSSPWNIFIRMILGCLVYGGALVGLRVITLTEIRSAVQAWRPNPNPAIAKDNPVSLKDS